VFLGVRTIRGEMSVRAFRSVRMSMAIGILTAVTRAPRADAAPEPTAARYETVKVAEGVFTFVPAEASTGIVSGNTTAVIGDDGVLVFDTGNFPSVTRRILADLRKLTDKPVRYVANSHWHFDHANGNAIFHEAFPGAVFLSSGFTRDRMAANFSKFDSVAYADMLEPEAKRLRGVIESGKKSDGTELSNAARAAYARVADDLEGAVPEYRAARLRLADVTFEDEVVVHLGRRDVRLWHAGRGNTAGDVVAFVPDVRVLATGDVLVLPVPYGFGSYPTEWVAVLKKLDALDAAVVIPGHGPVQRDRGALTSLASLLEAVVAQVKPLADGGSSLEEIRKKIDVETFRKRYTGGDPGRETDFQRFFLDPIVDRAFQEARGTFAPEG